MGKVNAKSRKRWLVCCCCGASAGFFKEHWNRDDGYGLCDNCIDFCARGSNEEEFRRSYGEPGVNYKRLPSPDAYARR